MSTKTAKIIISTEKPYQMRMLDPSAPFTFPRTGLVARNRTVLAAMTNRQSFEDGTLSQEEIGFLVRRAQGGFGIVTTACAHVTADGQGFSGELGVFDNKQLPGLRYLASQLRQFGALSLAQIFHAGLQAPQELTGVQPSSPSRLQAGPHLSHVDGGMTRPLSELEVKRLVEAFADAARRVYDAGFDGVELHGAHGYLINQFLGPETNKRRDQYGGEPTPLGQNDRGTHSSGRFRFLFDILAAIRARIPEDAKFLVGVRISPERNCGVQLQQSLALAEALSSSSANAYPAVDFLHLSCWDISVQSSLVETTQGPRGAAKRTVTKTLTEWFTSTVRNLPPVMTTGKIWDFADCQKGMQMGAQLVGSGRAAIGNPDWAAFVTSRDARMYRPLQPPYSEEHLLQCGLSPIFVYYMRRWKFVVDKYGNELEYSSTNAFINGAAGVRH